LLFLPCPPTPASPIAQAHFNFQAPKEELPFWVNFILLFPFTSMPSNTISFNGQQYKLSEILPEFVDLANMLASNAHLKAASPLAIDTDLSESDQKEVQTQVCSCF
jgi:ABC-type Na+ efflux pump permease subunit